MSVSGQSWAIERGQDASFIAVGEDTTNPSSWALLFSLFSYLPKSTPDYSTTSVTVTGPGSDGAYSLTVTLTRSQTIGGNLPKGTYYGGIWRTDTGSSIPLAELTLTIAPPTRSPS